MMLYLGRGVGIPRDESVVQMFDSLLEKAHKAINKNNTEPSESTQKYNQVEGEKTFM